MQAALNSANREGINICTCSVPTFAHRVVSCATKELTTSTAGDVCADRAAAVSNLLVAGFTLNAF